MVSDDKLNHMKIIKILVFIAVILFSSHIHAMAEHEEESSPTHHCVLVCHTCCLSTIPARIEIPLVQPVFRTVMSICKFSYQSPFLDTFKRPPVVSA
mgnify:CR=1 FL=1